MIQELDLIGRFTEIEVVTGTFPTQAIDEAYKALNDPNSMTPEEYASVSADHVARVIEASKNLIRHAIKRTLAEPEKAHTWGAPPRLQFNSKDESLSLWITREGDHEHVSIRRTSPSVLATEITAVSYDSHHRYRWDGGTFQHFAIDCIRQPTSEAPVYQRWKASIDNGAFTYFDKQLKAPLDFRNPKPFYG